MDSSVDGGFVRRSISVDSRHFVRARRDQLASDENVSRGARVRVQQFIPQTQRIDEFEQRIGGEETLRPELEAKTIFLLRRDNAAGADAGVQYTHGNPGLLEVIGARQAGNSTSDDDRWNRS